MASDLGFRLKKERNRLGLSQPQLAEVVGTSKNTVIAWEKGSTSPNAVQLSLLSELNLDVAYVLTGQRASNSQLSPTESLLLACYRDLCDSDRETLIKVGKALNALGCSIS